MKTSDNYYDILQEDEKNSQESSKNQSDQDEVNFPKIPFKIKFIYFWLNFSRKQNQP